MLCFPAASPQTLRVERHATPDRWRGGPRQLEHVLEYIAQPQPCKSRYWVMIRTGSRSNRKVLAKPLLAICDRSKKRPVEAVQGWRWGVRGIAEAAAVCVCLWRKLTGCARTLKRDEYKLHTFKRVGGVAGNERKRTTTHDVSRALGQGVAGCTSCQPRWLGGAGIFPAPTCHREKIADFGNKESAAYPPIPCLAVCSPHCDTRAAQWRSEPSLLPPSVARGIMLNSSRPIPEERKCSRVLVPPRLRTFQTQEYRSAIKIALLSWRGGRRQPGNGGEGRGRGAGVSAVTVPHGQGQRQHVKHLVGAGAGVLEELVKGRVAILRGAAARASYGRAALVDGVNHRAASQRRLCKLCLRTTGVATGSLGWRRGGRAPAAATAALRSPRATAAHVAPRSPAARRRRAP